MLTMTRPTQRAGVATMIKLIAMAAVLAATYRVLAAVDSESLNTMLQIGLVGGAAAAGWFGARAGSKKTEQKVKDNHEDIANLFRNYAEMEHELRGAKSEVMALRQERNQLQSEYAESVRAHGELQRENKQLMRDAVRYQEQAAKQESKHQAQVQKYEEKILSLEHRIGVLESVVPKN